MDQPPRFTGRSPLRPPPADQATRRRWPARIAAGVILLAAIGLLWPFAGWNWWPVVIGLGVLVLLYLLRLERLLLGWAPHLAGLVTVVLMAARSDPWAWGLTAGLALLGVGLARLPVNPSSRRWWPLAAGGLAVLVFGAGYAVVHYRTVEQQQAEQRAADAHYTAGRAALPAELVFAAITSDIASGDEVKACGLLGTPAGAQFAASTGAPDCPGAVRALRPQVRDPYAYANPKMPRGVVSKRADRTASVDGCAVWPSAAGAPGPRLGRLDLRLYEGSRYVVTGYTPCR